MTEWLGAVFTGLSGLGGYLPGILIGAWTGYITNEIALRMIFTEYRLGRLRLGGVIPRTRAQFTQGLLRLVDDELVRPETLRGQIESEAFTEAAARCVFDAAGRCLSEFGRYATVGEFAGAISGGNGDPVGWLADVAAEAGRDARALWERAIRSLCAAVGAGGTILTSEDAGTDTAGAAGRELVETLLVSIARNPEFAAARAEFFDSCGRVRLKSLVGERYFDLVGGRLAEALRGFSIAAGAELAEPSRAFCERVAYLLVDTRVLDAVAASLGHETLAELTEGNGRGGWDAFIAERLETAGYGGAADGREAGGGEDSGRRDGSRLTRALASALADSAALRDVKLADLFDVELSGIDAALTGVYARLTGFVREFLRSRREELNGMMETALEAAVAEAEQTRGGVTGLARKALFSGSVARYQVFDRLSAYLLTRCSDMAGERTVERALPGLLGRGVAGYLDRFDATDRDVETRVARALVGLPRALSHFRPGDALAALDDAGKADLVMALSGALSGLMYTMLTGGGHGRTAMLSAVGRAYAELGAKTPADLGFAASGMAYADWAEVIARSVRKYADCSVRKCADSAGGAASAAGGVMPDPGTGPVAAFDAPPSIQSGIALTALLTWLRGAAVSFARRASTAPAARALGVGLDAARRGGRIGALFTSLFDFAAGRLEKPLRAKIFEIIKAKLDANGDGELSALARQFFGQLRHIALLGALMGALIGCLSAALGSHSVLSYAGPPGPAAPVLSALIQVTLFALIGWITNVAALELLFRPRRDIKLLGFTFKSVISRNKARFAGAVGRFLDDLAARADASRPEPHRGRLVILARRIKAAVPVLVRDYGAANAAAAARWLAGWVRRAGRENARLIAERLVRAAARALGTSATRDTSVVLAPVASGEAGAAPVADVPSEADTSASAAPLAPFALPDGWIEDALLFLLNSDTPISELYTDRAVAAFEASVRERLYKLDAIWPRSLIRRALLAVLEPWYERRAGAPLLPERAALGRLLTAFIGKTAPRILAALSADPTAPLVSDALAAGVAGGEPDDFIFDTVRGICLAHEREICAALRRRFAVGLAEKSDALAESLVSGLKERAGLLPSIALKLADGNDIIRRAAKILLVEQFPIFLESRASELDILLGRLLRLTLRVLSEPSVRGRYFRPNTRRIYGLAAELTGESAVATAAAELMAAALDGLFCGVTVGETAGALGIAGVKDVAVRCDRLVRAVADAFANSARIEAADLADAASVYASRVLREAGSRVTVSELFGDARRSDLTVLAESLRESFFTARRLETLWRRSLYATLRDSGPAVERLLERTLCDMLGEEGEPALREALEGLLLRAVRRFDALWAGGFADGASALIAGAGYDAFTAGLPEVIRAVDLRAVAEKEINAMDTRGIERVFRSFAGGYMRRLKLYGLWGGLFGLHAALPAATAAAALFEALRGRIKKRR